MIIDILTRKKNWNFTCLIPTNICLTSCGARISTKNHTFCIFHSNDGRLHQPRILDIQICTKDYKTKGDEKIFNFKTISWFCSLDWSKMLKNDYQCNLFCQIRCKRNFWLFIDSSKSFKKDSQCTLFHWIWCNGILDWLMSLRKDYQCDFFYWIWYSAICDWSKSLGKDYQCTILWWLWCNGIIDWSKSLKKYCWCNFFCWI